MRGVACFLFLLLAGAGCAEDAEPELPEHPSYAEHIAPLMSERCVACHGSNVQGEARQGAPEDLNLDSYDDVKRHSAFANGRIQAGTMPPGGLSERERSLFARWLEQGMAP